MMADPQVNARDMVVCVNAPVAGDIKVAGNPVKVTGQADKTSFAPPPELDRHRAQVIQEFIGTDDAK